MNKIIEIDGKSVGLCANALTPRIYRHKIGRDIVRDLQKVLPAILELWSLNNKTTAVPKKK